MNDYEKSDTPIVVMKQGNAWGVKGCAEELPYQQNMEDIRDSGTWKMREVG